MCRSPHVLAVALLVLLSGCTTHYAYVPQPAVVMLRTQAESADQARIIVNVGATRPGSSNQQSTIDLAIRVENLGPGSVTFDPHQVAVLDAGLHDLSGSAGDIEPATLEPGQSVLRSLSFVLPPGASPGQDVFSMLNVRFTLRTGDRDFPHTMIFNRVDYYYYPYYYYGAYPRYGYRYWW